MNSAPFQISAGLRDRLDASEKALRDLVANGDEPRRALTKEMAGIEATRVELSSRIAALKPTAHASDEAAAALAGAETRLRQVNEILSQKQGQLAALPSPHCGDNCISEIVAEYLEGLSSWADSFFAPVEPRPEVRLVLGRTLSCNIELRQLRQIAWHTVPATAEGISGLIVIYNRARRGQVNLLSDPNTP
jgi:hypothetical protein